VTEWAGGQVWVRVDGGLCTRLAIMPQAKAWSCDCSMVCTKTDLISAASLKYKSFFSLVAQAGTTHAHTHTHTRTHTSFPDHQGFD